MWPFFQGLGIGAGLIVAIGAQNVFVFSLGVRKQNSYLVPAICSFCDACLICIGVAGVGSVVATSPQLQQFFGWGGAIFLGWYGIRALRAAIVAKPLRVNSNSRPSRWAVAMSTLAVSLLNPHVYLDTLVLLGGSSGRFEESDRLLFGLGACAASVVWFFMLSLSGTLLAPFFQSSRAWRVLDIIVWITMWTLAWQLIPE